MTVWYRSAIIALFLSYNIPPINDNKRAQTPIEYVCLYCVEYTKHIIPIIRAVGALLITPNGVTPSRFGGALDTLVLQPAFA